MKRSAVVKNVVKELNLQIILQIKEYFQIISSGAKSKCGRIIGQNIRS